MLIHYEYPVLIGDLSGMDMLLGMDWLYATHAQLEFNTMTVRIGPVIEAPLRTTRRPDPMMRDGNGFVHAREPTILVA